MILWHLLLALAAVAIAGRLVGAGVRRLGQPAVIGEILAGILLGPSFLGRVSPDVSAYLLPPDLMPTLGLLAQIGVVVYMFLVGLELNLGVVREQLRSTLIISNTSIVVPFALGLALAIYLHPILAPAGVGFTNFALFLGVSMSITAFPVLARILADLGMTQTRIGMLALTAAAVGDVTAWCLLAFVVGVVQSTGHSLLLIALMTATFIAIMVTVVRPLFARLSTPAVPSPEAVAWTLIALLLSALATEAIGIHAIFGAFMLGAMIPHSSGLARSLEQSGGLMTLLILPAFFAFTGMRTEIGLVSGGRDWMICGLIVLVATVGKFGGSYVAGRATGLDARYAAGVGVLMNTRGLMELIVLNVGLDLGVISPTLFTMLVIMALATTIATTPILQMLIPEARSR
jgi:Kef-type K+ transport system membrane component KefB